MSDDPIKAFLDAIEAAALDRADVFTDRAVLDATVPNWRFQLTGPTPSERSTPTGSTSRSPSSISDASPSPGAKF